MKDFIIALILCAIPGAHLTEPVFSSKRLHDLYWGLSDSIQKQLLTSDSVSYLVHSQVNSTIYCEKNDEGIIQHLGIKFFDYNQNRQFPQEIIRYCERFLLECVLCKDAVRFRNSIASDRLQCCIDNVPVQSGNTHLLGKIPELFSKIDSMSLIHAANYVTVSLITANNRKLTVKIPALHTVIMGMDKPELDRNLYCRIIASKDSSFVSDTVSDTAFELVADSLYVKRGEVYQKNLSSDLYYFVKNNKRSIVCDSTRFAETLRNLCLRATDYGTQVKLNVSQFSYKNTIKKYSVNLNKFHSVFNQDFQGYFGIEKQDTSEILGLLIIYHAAFNYLNLVSVKAEKKKLFSRNPEMDILFHTNIPSDNVENLYGVMPAKKRKTVDTFFLQK
jgi:hypothetical protein